MLNFYSSRRILVGYIIAYFSFFPFIHRHRQIRRKDPDALQPEARLYWLLYSKFHKVIPGNSCVSHMICVQLPHSKLLVYLALRGQAWVLRGTCIG